MPPVGCQLSTLKKAEEGDELILRLFNPSDSQSSDATVASCRAIQACTQTRLDEQPVKSVDEKRNDIGPVLPGQTRTFSYKIV